MAGDERPLYQRVDPSIRFLHPPASDAIFISTAFGFPWPGSSGASRSLPVNGKATTDRSRPTRHRWPLTPTKRFVRNSISTCCSPSGTIAHGRRIEDILGFPWAQGGEQLSCVLSGNYRRCGGGIDITDDRAASFLATFAVPVARKTVASYVERPYTAPCGYCRGGPEKRIFSNNIC